MNRRDFFIIIYLVRSRENPSNFLLPLHQADLHGLPDLLVLLDLPVLLVLLVLLVLPDLPVLLLLSLLLSS